MKRRRVLALCSSLTIIAGCTEGNTGDRPDSSSKSTPTVTENNTPSGTSSTSPTPAPPYRFAIIRNSHTTNHTVKVTIKNTSSGETMVLQDRQIAADSQNTLEITDEWSNKKGPHELHAELNDGQSSSIDVETDKTWACTHTIDIAITSDGKLQVSLSSAMREGC